MTKLQVGLIQMSSGENPAENLKQLKRSLERVVTQGDPDLIITPENSLFMRVKKSTPIHGFELGDDLLKDLQETVNQGRASLILGSIPLKTADPTRFKNAMVLLEPGQKPRVIYQKIHLFDVDVEGQPRVRESEIFEPGLDPQILDFKGFCFGLSICYDLRFSELYSVYAKKEVDALLIPSAFLVPTGRAHWEVLIRARAIESQCYALAPAQGGTSKGADEAFRETYGHSLAVDPWGGVLLELDPENATGVVTLERDKINKVRSQIPMKGHRRL